jgi:3-oxoacyl-[acyl-carrier-protein] synthase III
MRFDSVAIESIGYCLPDECVTSDEIERQLAPLYERLKLPPGRLELMTGIAERRFWPLGLVPSDRSIPAGELAILASDFPRQEIGCLIHGSVCRDHLEPATASRVHHELQLGNDCVLYDVSNACLGMLNGMLQIAAMIELGHIQAGLVVGCESARPLVATTVESLNSDRALTRRQIKTAVASLTIGSASSAILLVHKARSRYGTALHTIITGAATAHHRLCQSDKDTAVADGMHPLMETDSEALLTEGIAAARRTYDVLRSALPSGRALDKTVCHQVGSAHRKALLQRLDLPLDNDFATYPWLGNTGSSALPVSLAIACQHDHFTSGDEVGLLGIGSGINVIMLGATWRGIAVRGVGPVGLQSRVTSA